MDTEPKGRRSRPPRLPPTARGTLPPPGPPRNPSRIACFSGPEKRVGKTTVALNLALAWAGSQSRNVLIIQLDPRGSRELRFLLGIRNPPSLESLSGIEEHDAGTLAKRLKGRIPISQWGVGVLPLGSKRSGALRPSPDVILPILAALSESYDLFLDVHPFLPMQILAYGLADIIFWITLPLRSHFKAAQNHFEEIKPLRFPSDRFEIVLNEADPSGACAPKEAEKFFGTKGKRILSHMPRERRIVDFAENGRIWVVEQPQSPWANQLRPLLGRLMELKPTAKRWDPGSLGSRS